jgi:hypothetical protein
MTVFQSFSGFSRVFWLGSLDGCRVVIVCLWGFFPYYFPFSDRKGLPKTYEALDDLWISVPSSGALGVAQGQLGKYQISLESRR